MKVSIFSIVAGIILFYSCSDRKSEIEDLPIRIASDFGFLPGKAAEENNIAFQMLLDLGGRIIIDIPGTYDLSEEMRMYSNTHLVLKSDVHLRKQKKDGVGASYLLINEGAYSGNINENITIEGGDIVINDVDDNGEVLLGLTGHLAFFHVKNLTLRNISCFDLKASRYFLQIADFENLTIENFQIEGLKDGIHLCKGKNFKISNCTFKTYDDPIALNAHDYFPIGQPCIGWIENGIIENCYDLNDESTTGYFCRLISASWVDWYSGMKVRKGDIVVNNNRLYRVLDSYRDPQIEYTSVTPPMHLFGTEELDGIKWVMFQEGALYSVGCRNIQFKNIFLQKKRHTVFSLHFDNDSWSRSYYPNSVMAKNSNISFENIQVQNDIQYLVNCVVDVDALKFTNCKIKNNEINIFRLYEGMNYSDTHVAFDRTTFQGEGKQRLCTIGDGRTGSLTITNSVKSSNTYEAIVSGVVDITGYDIPIVGYPLP